MRIKITAILWLLAAVPAVLKAQDPQFSQFFANQVLLSPAFTGAAGGPRVALNFRSQWSSIPGSFRTFAAAYDQPVRFGRTNNGIGVSLMADVAGEGDLTKIDALLNYSFELPLTKSRRNQHIMRFGISAGVQTATLDFFKLRFPDQLGQPAGTPTADLPGNTTRVREALNLGVVYYNKYVYAGVSVFHLTQPRQIFIRDANPSRASARLPVRIQGFVGGRIPLDGKKDRMYLSPALMVRSQGPFLQIDGGLYWGYDPIIIGIWYRHNDAVMGLVGFKKGIFSVGYSYDYTISRLTNAVSGGSHEVSVILEFERGQKKKRGPRSNLSCPRF
jgi:type IX secretion system PorP/SprF family membrane protein